MPPTGPIPEPPADPARSYCRAARRLRGRFTGRPARLHRELRELAGRHDRSTAAEPAQGPYHAFAAEVARRLEGPVLRHAQRLRLLGIARAMGIERFEANLAIAAVQHRQPGAPAPSPAPSSPAHRTSYGPLLLVIALETLIAWGAWSAFHG